MLSTIETINQVVNDFIWGFLQWSASSALAFI